MAIGVKVMKRPEREVSYIRATLKGMALTFKHMFQPKVTMQYPEERSTADQRPLRTANSHSPTRAAKNTRATVIRLILRPPPSGCP